MRFATVLLAVVGPGLLACGGSETPRAEGRAGAASRASVATLSQLCTGILDATHREREVCPTQLATSEEACVEDFQSGLSRSQSECPRLISLLLQCVGEDVRFGCDPQSGLPYPVGQPDPETNLLDEYCEEEWFRAYECVYVDADEQRTD